MALPVGGFASVIVTPQTTNVIAIPEEATSVVIWFATSTADNTMIAGAVLAVGSDTEPEPLETITSADQETRLGHHYPSAIEYPLREQRSYGEEASGATHLHLYSWTDGAVAYGTWYGRV